MSSYQDDWMGWGHDPAADGAALAERYADPGYRPDPDVQEATAPFLAGVREDEAARANGHGRPMRYIDRPDDDESAAMLVSLGTLRESHPHLRPPIIHGLMREGETLNIIAPPKVGKSWMAMDLALTVATGGRWLDRHQTVCGRVLYIDNELHPETLSHRIGSVAYARGIPPEDIADRIDVLTLRGRLTDIHGLATMLSRIEPGTYSVVVLDALYRMLPAGTSENDNAGMAQVYNALDSIAGRMRCGIVLVHHSSKGIQSDKSVTDVGSGAGSQSRAADAHLVLREHDEEACYVMDAVVRSWAPPEPLVLRWEFPVWMPADELDPTRLRQAQTAGDARQQRRDREGMDAILGALDRGPQTRHQLRQLCGFGFDRINRLIARLIDSGEARTTYSEGNTDLIEKGGL